MLLDPRSSRVVSSKAQLRPEKASTSPSASGSLRMLAAMSINSVFDFTRMTQAILRIGSSSPVNPFQHDDEGAAYDKLMHVLKQLAAMVGTGT